MNNFAITSAGIGEAMQRSASALYSAGNSIEESTALITAANSVIQNPEQVGTALKTLALRLRGAKVELEEAGLETDNMAESTSTLQAKLQALTHGKVNIMEDADTFKNTTQILREMSAAWEHMTDIERAAALELMGGKRQANILSSVITNFETVEEVIEEAMNSSGSAMAENEKWLDSIEGKSTQLASNMQAVWEATISTDTIKFFYDLAIAASDMAKNVGLILPVLIAVLAYFTAFKKQNPANIFSGMIVAAQNYQQALYKLNALQSSNLLGGTFDATSVNAYATAVSGLTAKQQASLLATQQLNKEQIREILLKNSVEEAVINETLSKMTLKTATDTMTTATISEALATQLSEEAMKEKVVADFLASNGTKKLTAELLNEMVQLNILTADQAEQIASTYALAGANNVAGASFKTLGLSIKAAFTSNPIGMIMMIISGIVMLASKIKQAKEEVVESAKETVSAYQESQKTLEKQKKTIDELSESYEKLSKGVDLDTNENISLTTKSYEEYLGICNDIADMYPHLVTGFDAQGNAILSLKGNVNGLTQAYKDAAQAARQAMIAGGGDIWETFNNTYSSDPIASWEDTGMVQKLQLAKKMQQLLVSGTQDEINNFFNELNRGAIEIDGIKYSGVERDDLFEAAGINFGDFRNAWDGTIDIDKFQQQSTKLLSFIKSTTTAINTETLKVKSLMDAYLGEDLDYVGLSEKSRSYVDQVVASLDAEFISGFNSADELYNYIKTNIVDVFKDKSVVDAIADLSNLQLEFDKGNILYSDYQEQLTEYLNKIQNKFDEETLSQIKVGIGIDEASLTTSVNHILELLGQNAAQGVTDDSPIWSLSVEDLQIAGQLEVPEGIILGWDELVAKIKEAKIVATKDFDITNYTESISSLSSTISEYQEALQKLDKGSFTMDDFMELIGKNPELAKGVDISSNAFHGLADNLKRAAKTSTKSFINDLKELKTSMVAAGKSTDSVDQLIEAVENMPDDALDSIIDKYSTLADEINKARVAQNKLSESMQENPNEGYETRGEAMEYMKEAMSKGEIGSESNLWNVAKQYGFTYDSAKTINENADALAKFIATRERWFKTEDDGDDRTSDGYSYEGTENFIKDVESAVKNSAELQQYLTWDYDESTGALSFDYNNEDWDTIIDILSRTKQLAGLTSEEFADLMIQVGQYFGIDWGNYDDVLSHLNGIATGSADAKTKVEQYGQAMQNYFGENSDVDLTTRPIVKSQDMKTAGWSDVEDDSYATVYSSTFSNTDGTKSIVVTPILPDGTVLSPDELSNYANKLLEGEDVDPNVKIKLAEFDGYNSITQANEYAQALHEAQAGYDSLRDTLQINTIINEKGLAGLKDIEAVQQSIITKSDGTFVIDETAFTDALEGAQYTADQIDLIIEKIKTLNNEAFNVDPLSISDTLETQGISGLKEINQLQSAIKEDADTGLVILDTDMFTSVLQESGYTKEQIQLLIDKIKEYQSIVAVSNNTDPLGLNNASLSADSLKASLNSLGVAFTDTLGRWFDGKRDINISVQDMASTLKEKGWSDEAIKNYITKLANTNLEGFRINISTAEIDDAIKKANEVPDQKQTDYEVYGTGVKTLEDLENRWNVVTADKTTNYTIHETTIKETQDKTKFNLFDPSTWANGTANVNGTAFSGGSWGAPRTETALTGELGPEILVRNGRWRTIGENGAEFTQIKKGDIIFNHRQTEELLKNGHVTGRGKAYADGTAYATGDGIFASYDFSGSGGYIKYDVNDNVVESWGDISGAAKDASDAAEDFAETLDWVEIRLEEINEQLDLMDAQLENASTAASKNNIIDQMIGVNNNKMQNLQAGLKKYSDYAAKLLADVPAQYREAAQDGAISITEFAGEADEKTVEAIKNYREWAQKVANLRQELEETKTTIRDLAMQKFENERESGDMKANYEDDQNDKLQNAIDYDEARGVITSDAYYREMMNNTQQKIDHLIQARQEMQKRLDEGVKSGDITKYSPEWYDLISQMYEIDSQIDEATIDIEEFQNSINDIYWDNFDNLISDIQYLKDDTQNLIDLMANAGELISTPEGAEFWGADDVQWTKEGMASLGLYAQQMEIAEFEAAQYAAAIDKLTQDYEAGLYSESEYKEKLNELTEGQHDAIDSYYEAQDAIVDLNKTRIDAIKDGIEKEIDAYEELINKKKEELEAEQDLYNFQKSTQQQQKNIADIQRKLAALAGDNSASAIAQRKKLEAELAEANAELEDSYYQRSIDNKQNALDQEYDDFKAEKDAEIEALDEYLANVEQIVTDSLGVVQANAAEIGQTLTDKTEEYGVTVSDAILSPWKDGAIAVSDYQTAFGTAVSSTTDQLEGLKNKWQEVIDKMVEASNTNIATITKENANYEGANKTPEPSSDKTPSTTPSTSPAKTISVNGKINAGNAKIYASKGGSPLKQYYSNDPIYTVLDMQGDWLKVRYHKASSGVTGWFKKGDVKAYAKGTLGVAKDQWALIDELGEELVLHAGANGKLQYLTKGTAVIPHDLTDKLMNLAMNPQMMLDQNRPMTGLSKGVINNTMEIKVDASVGTLLNIEHLDGGNPEDVAKMVDKAWDKKMQGLNNAMRKFTR